MHPDVPEEQRYFDHALDLRERLEANLDRAASLAADPKTAMELRRRVGALGVVDPGQAVAFGRIDVDGDRWYIGRGAIWDENNDLVVVNWQAPIAAPFYTARPGHPEGLDRRRIFRCRNNRILDIDELVFREVARAVARGSAHPPSGPVPEIDISEPTGVTGQHSIPDLDSDLGAEPEPMVSDALLDALSRERSGHLSDIVATIQASQYEVIAHPPEELLIVQGAPGTGKTVVGLHRVSWLLFNRRDRIGSRDVLVVGPNPGFLRYISAVLPSLGDEAVVQLPVVALGPRVRIGRVDTPDVRRLKGDRRMLRFVLRGLRSRQRVGRNPVELTVEGRRVEVEAADLASRARQLAGQPHNEARRHLRSYLVDEGRRQLARRRFREAAMLDANVQTALAQEVDAYLDRAWPRLTPQGFLVELLASQRRREVAGAGLLSDEEIELLAIPHGLNVSSLSWSVDDIALLDLADALLNGTPASYEYIVVDEAQDLSPMQFESIRRRSRTGWMTVLGDLAQGTSPWVPDSWEDVALHLRRDAVPTELTELSLGYRLPTEVHEVAMRLLPEIAPGLRTPRALRSSGHPVSVTAARPAELTAAVVRAVRACGGGLVGVVTAAADRARVREALEAEGLACADELGAFPAPPIVVLGSEEVKGLEFDNVVVVEPAAIVAESPQGLRALFVAVTRPTSRLALVHAEPLPTALGLQSPSPAAEAGPSRVPHGPFAPLSVDVADDEDDDVGGGGYEEREPDWWPPSPHGPPEPPEPPERPELPGRPARPTTIVLTPSGSSSTGASDNGTGLDEAAAAAGIEEEPPPPKERSTFTLPASTTPGPAGIDLRADPFAALDREMARALATKLAEALTRYATPSLVPLVVDEMAEILEVDKPRVTGTGQDNNP